MFMLTPDPIRQNTAGVADNDRKKNVRINPLICFPFVPKLQIPISKYRNRRAYYIKAIMISLNQQLWSDMTKMFLLWNRLVDQV